MYEITFVYLPSVYAFSKIRSAKNNSLSNGFFGTYYSIARTLFTKDRRNTYSVAIKRRCRQAESVGKLQ